MLISPKPTSRPRSCEFGLGLTSGLPVVQEWPQIGVNKPTSRTDPLKNRRSFQLGDFTSE
jgi:hypothetical protein